MEEAPENGKESSHSARANGINECNDITECMFDNFVTYKGLITGPNTHTYLSFRIFQTDSLRNIFDQLCNLRFDGTRT